MPGRGSPGVARCATAAGRRERTGAAARAPPPRTPPRGLVQRVHRRSRLCQRPPLAGEPYPECLAVAHGAGQGQRAACPPVHERDRLIDAHRARERDLGAGTGQDLDRDLQEDGERPERPALAVTCIKPYSGSNTFLLGNAAGRLRDAKSHGYTDESLMTESIRDAGSRHPVTISIMEVLNERRKDQTRRA